MENMQEELRENWAELHHDFAKELPFLKRTYQQEWENHGINYSEAQRWIAQGFAPDDIRWGKRVGHWFNLEFTSEEAKFWNLWIRFLGEKYLPFLASYAREKGYYQNKTLGERFNNPKNLRKLWREYYSWREEVPSQKWFDFVYPERIRSQVKENLRLLNISHTGLDTGLECLPLSLEEFYCSETKLQEELEKHIRRGELVEKHSNYLFLLNRWRKESSERMKNARRFITDEKEELSTEVKKSQSITSSLWIIIISLLAVITILVFGWIIFRRKLRKENIKN